MADLCGTQTCGMRFEQLSTRKCIFTPVLSLASSGLVWLSEVNRFGLVSEAVLLESANLAEMLTAQVMSGIAWNSGK